jgi:integrase
MFLVGIVSRSTRAFLRFETQARIRAQPRSGAGPPECHQHAKVRDLLKMPEDFVVHSLRHTILPRLGLLGVDAFTIMKIAGHSSIRISQRCVRPSPESVESPSKSWKCPISPFRGKKWA